MIHTCLCWLLSHNIISEVHEAVHCHSLKNCSVVFHYLNNLQCIRFSDGEPLGCFHFLMLWINCYVFFWTYILSHILRRGIVELHGQVMFSSNRYCGCSINNIYSCPWYMNVSSSAIFSNIWCSQFFNV